METLPIPVSGWGIYLSGTCIDTKLVCTLAREPFFYYSTNVQAAVRRPDCILIQNLRLSDNTNETTGAGEAGHDGMGVMELARSDSYIYSLNKV